MKNSFLHSFGKANTPLVLVFLSTIIWSQALWADVSVTSLSQSPAEGALVGNKVTYTLQLENPGADIPFPTPIITVSSNQGALPSDFKMESGSCKRDGNTFYDCAEIGSVDTVSFSFIPDKEGTYSFNFGVECSNKHSEEDSSNDGEGGASNVGPFSSQNSARTHVPCKGDSRDIATTVGQPKKPVSGNIVFDATSYTVDEDKGPVILTLNRVNGNDGEITATVKTNSDNQAMEGEDYKSLDTKVKFEAGDTSKTVSIDIIQNEDGEENGKEDFYVSLSDDANTAGSSATVTIIDVPKGEPGVLQFSASNYPVTEPANGANGSVNITVNRVGGASGALSAAFSIKSGTAKEGAGQDYTNPPENGTTLTWADNDDTPKTISIPILSDDAVEPDPETFTVILAGDAPTETATVTITDGTPPPEAGSAEFSLGDYPTDEGKTAEITINRIGDVGAALAATVRLGGNAASGTDYDPPAAEQLNLNWAADDNGSRTLNIPITADTEVNEEEVITLELLDANGGVISSSKVTITDTTPPPEAGSAEFSLGDYPTDEGKTAEITINRIGDVGAALAATVRLGGNAASGTDYDPPAAEQLNLNWAADDNGSRTLNIPITADTEVNEEEVITLELLDANGGVISSSKVTITDTTPPPEAGSAEFSLGDYPTDEGKTAEITINRTGDVGATLATTVRLGGNAASGTDYDPPAAEQLNLNWAADDNGSRTLNIPITADTEVNEEEVITLELLNANNEVISSSKVTINDTTEASGSAQFSSGEYEAKEGSLAVVTINRSGSTVGSLDANVEISDGTGAKMGSDYNLPLAEQLNLNWKAGEDTPRTIEIPIQPDDDVDPDETINLSLVSEGKPIGSATVKIIDDTDPGSAKFSSSEVSADEGSNAKVTINREGSSAGPLTVNVEVSDGVGAKAGTDYDLPSAANLTVSWNANESTPRVIEIPIRKDSEQEPEETINLKLLQEGKALDNAIVKITDTTELSVAKFALDDFPVFEGVGIANVTINREGGTDGALSASVRVSNGSATTPEDYDPPAQLSVSWQDGEADSREIQIPIRKDDIPEPDETINLTLLDVSGAEIGSATVTISETTNVGTVRFISESFEFTEGKDAEVKVIRENGSDGELAVTVGVGLAGDSATSGEDYQPPADTRITWKNGDSGERILRIPLKADSVVEENETISLQLFEKGKQKPSGSATVVIKDETQLGTVRFSSDVFEGEEGTSAEISVTREQGDDGELSVDLVVGREGDTASSSEDYAAPSDTVLTWGPKESGAKTISIPLLLDDQEESGEFVSLQLRQGEQILGDAQLNIHDVGVLGDAASSVSEVNIVEGNRQTGQPGDELQPFVVKVLNANGEAVEAVSVNWSINPESGGSLSGGADTETDLDGKSRNTFTLNTAERVVITATILKGTISAQERRRGPQARAEGDPSVEFIVNGGIADTEGLNANQKSVGAALDGACPAIQSKPEAERTAGEKDLLATCSELQAPGGNPDAIAERLSLLAPDEITAQGTAIIEAANLQVMSINARLNALRSGAKGLDLSGLSFNIDGQTLPGSVMNALMDGQAKGGAAGDAQDLSGKLGVFINGNFSFGDKDDTENETGFEFDSQGITIGVDYRLSNQLIFGGAVGVTKNKSDFNNNSGSLELDGVHLMAYGTYYQAESFYLDGLIKLGSNDFATRRRVSRTEDALQEAAGDTDGQEYSLSLSGGYDYNVGALSYGPYGRLSYTRAEIDAFSESASNPGVAGEGSVLSLSDQEVDSATAVLGGQVSYAISRPSGVFMPQARLEWEHEFANGSRELSAQFVHDPTRSTFSITTDEPDRDYLNLGLGFSMVAAEGRSGFLYYESRLDQDNITQNWIKAGVRLEFR